MTEQEAQIKIIEYFLQLNRDKELIVALEVPFYEYRRRADVVFIVDGFTYAVEIKTELDNVCKLKEQVSDYRKVFDYTYIATEGKNFSKVISERYGNTGILKLGKKVLQHRISRINKKLNKVSLLSSSDFSYIKSQSSTVVKSTKQESIYETVKKIRLEECRKIFLNFLISRYLRRSSSFLSEIGSSIHTDDLLILSRPDADLY